MSKITTEELNLWVAQFENAFVKVMKDRPLNPFAITLAMLNGYLHICKKHGIPKKEYETIKNALQDIAGWYHAGIDIETFEEKEINEERRTLRLNND